MAEEVKKEQVEQAEPVKILNETDETIGVGNFEETEDIAWSRSKLYEILSKKSNLLAAPTHTAKDFPGQFAFFGNNLYVNVEGTWYMVNGGKYAIGTKNINSGGTGNETLTVGFTTKFLKITSFAAGANGATCEGWGTSASSYNCFRRYLDSGNWTSTNSDSFIIWVVDGGAANPTKAIISSITATTVVLEVTDAGTDVAFKWEAFG